MSQNNRVVVVESLKQFDEITSKTSLSVAHFWAPWSQPSVDMCSVVEVMAEEYPAVQFLKVEAEQIPDLSLRCEVSAVPTFVFIRSKSIVERLNGANNAMLKKLVKQHSSVDAIPGPVKPSEDGVVSAEALNDRLKKLVNVAPIMLFMKGDPETPRCGFSRQMCQLLTENGVKFNTFDILTDDQVRQGLKKFSDWPTYPQLYVKGELAGGLDIAKELVSTGELKEMASA